MWIALIVGGGLLVLALILVIPRRSGGDDAPLPTEIETQLLLGEDPDQPFEGEHRSDPIPPS
jgi:hypothetical protein